MDHAACGFFSVYEDERGSDLLRENVAKGCWRCRGFNGWSETPLGLLLWVPQDIHNLHLCQPAQRYSGGDARPTSRRVRATVLWPSETSKQSDHEALGSGATICRAQRV